MEKKISSDLVYDGKVVKVYHDTVETEKGNVASRDVVRHMGGAGVIAMDENNEIYLVKQFRYAVGEELIEIPAGKLEPNEEPMITAGRELIEEAGITSDNIKPLGKIIPTCGYCDEIIYVYYATDIKPSQQNLDEDEELTVFKMPLSEAVDAVFDGRIIDGKTTYAILALNEMIKNR